MSRTTLIVLGIVVLLMGVAALIPSLELATEPTWHAIAKVVIGIIAIWIGAADKASA